MKIHVFRLAAIAALVLGSAGLAHAQTSGTPGPGGASVAPGHALERDGDDRMTGFGRDESDRLQNHDDRTNGMGGHDRDDRLRDDEDDRLMDNDRRRSDER